MKEQYKTLRLLDHPNVCKAYYMFINEDSKDVHIVTELFEYGTLKEYLERKGKLDQIETVKIISKVVNGDQYLHQKGVCHRDLKPENIMYDPETESLKIIDFEIAKRRKYNSEKFAMWSNTGTLHYKAPEMF